MSIQLDTQDLGVEEVAKFFEDHCDYEPKLAATDHGLPPVRLRRELPLKDRAKAGEVLPD